MINNIIIEEKNGAIAAIRIAKDNEIQIDNTPLIAKAKKQLQEYLDGQRKIFDLPILIQGTDFQKRVYQATLEIPYGQTKTYKEIARIAGNELASRAVGQALNRNKLLIIVPCHRVIGTNNSLTGFALGLESKQKLLYLEKSVNNL